MLKWGLSGLLLGLMMIHFIFLEKSWLSVEKGSQRNVANISRAKTNEEILVFRKGVRPYLTKAPEQNSFDIRSTNSGLELEKLKKYLLDTRQAFGVSNDSENFQLKLHSVYKKGSTRVFVKFHQVQEREVAGNKYTIPVTGGSLVAFLRGKRIDRVNTSLKSIRKKDFNFSNPGFDFSGLSDLELSILSEQIAQSNNKEKIEEYFNQVFKKAGLSENFDVEAFLQLSTSQQRKTLVNLFGQINKVGTFRMLIKLAQSELISLVQYGSKKAWMYTVKQPFELDLEFDIEIPQSADEKLKVKNLRQLSYDSEVSLHLSPHFPIEMGEPAIVTNSQGQILKVPEKESSEADFITATNFKKLSDYYKKAYDWHFLNGKKEDSKNIVVHAQIEGRYLGSARWSSTREVFLLGANGRGWVDKGRSFSILGHEYFHALIHYSSSLVYQGQSGALNEHLADIQGVIFEADERNSGNFDFTIGDEGVLSSSMQEEIRTKNEKWAAENNLSQGHIEKYNVVGAHLRNLYYPEASKHRQYSNYQKMLEEFPEDCEPSANNDNCGVHYGSGVLNKAVAQMIDDIGMEKMRHIIFNTALYRLNSQSDFMDYALQLYEECYEQAGNLSLSKEQQIRVADCEVLVRHFISVGLDVDVSQVTLKN